MLYEKSENNPQTILVADDEPVNRELMKRRLEREGYVVLTARHGAEAFEKASASQPDLIILDIMMPLMDGLQACLLMKENERTRDIPIIFLSARDETEMKVSGLSLGANDYISKPFQTEELLARVRVALRLKRERDNLRLNMEEARGLAEIAEERAATDALTGLLNRYGLEHILSREQAEARRYSRSLSCLLIDLDKFKIVNDTYGHATGDVALRQLAEVLKEVVRRSDMIFRYGGEEFLVLLPETDMDGAIALAEKIRTETASRLFGQGARSFHLTLSAGASTLRADESGDEMISRADIALYHAKEHGRNRVEFAVG